MIECRYDFKKLNSKKYLDFIIGCIAKLYNVIVFLATKI